MYLRRSCLCMHTNAMRARCFCSATTVSVDVSRLRRAAAVHVHEPATGLLRELQSRIRFQGSMTVAEYMTAALTHQADAATLRECAEHGPFDLIVDDGSHFPEHQMLAFETLFAAVKPGGVFIIEDIETSYWPVGHQLYGNYMTGETNVVESFKRIADRVNHEFTGHDYPAVAADVESVTFAQNCVIVTKRDTPHESEASYDDRPYRFANTPGHVFPNAEAASERPKAPPSLQAETPDARPASRAGF